MAIQITNLTAPNFTSFDVQPSYSTPSWTPPTSGIILAVVFNEDYNLSPATIPTMSGNNVTWKQVDTEFASWRRLTVFAAEATGSTTGSTTISFGTADQFECAALFYHLTGANIEWELTDVFTDPTSRTTSTGVTSFTAYLFSPVTYDKCYFAAVVHFKAESTNPQAGWTELDDVILDIYGLETQWTSDAANRAMGASWATASRYIAIGFPIRGQSTRPENEVTSLRDFIFCTGPYNGLRDLGYWNGNVGGFTDGLVLPTIDQTITRHGDGDACYKFTYSTGQNGVFGWYSANNATNYVVMRVYFRFDVLPTSGTCDIASLDASGNVSGPNERAWVRYNAATGKLEALIALQGHPTAGPVQGTSISAGTWYKLDMKVRSDGGQDTVTLDWSVDNSPQNRVSMSALDTVTGFDPVAGLPDVWWFGQEIDKGVESPVELRFQDILVSYDPTTYPLPDGRTIVLRPRSAGTHVGESDFQDDDGSPIDANSYLKLRDDASGTETDWLAQKVVSSSYLEFLLDDFSGENILGAQAQIGTNHPGVSGVPNISFRMVDSAGNPQRFRYASYSADANAGFFTSVYSPNSFSTDQVRIESATLFPESGLDWNDSITGLRVRIGFSTDVTPLLRVQHFIVEVAIGQAAEDIAYWGILLHDTFDG